MVPPRRALRVLIVGAGPGGLLLAMQLRQRGVDVTVIDKVHSFRRSGYALALWTLRGPRSVGAEDAVLRRARRLERYVILDRNGGFVRDTDFAAFERRYQPILQIHRGELHEALLEVAERSFRIEVKLGLSVLSFDERAEEVGVSFSDGTSAAFDVVVGADGSRSRVRQLLWGDEGLIHAGMRGWVYLLPPDFPFAPEIAEYWDSDRFFGFYPCGERSAVLAGVKARPGPPTRPEARQALLRSNFGNFGGRAAEALDRISEVPPGAIYEDDLHGVVLRRWRKGRIVLMGDAAHALIPFIGAGAVLAMDDACVLADELGRATPHEVGYALDNYFWRRWPKIAPLVPISLAKGLATVGPRWAPLKLRSLIGLLPAPGLPHRHATIHEWTLDKFVSWSL